MINFNLPVDQAGISNYKNFSFEPANKVLSAQLSSSKQSEIIIKSYQLKIENITSDAASGSIKINDGAGSSIILSGYRENLSSLYVYPNPAVIGSGIDKITFANLTRKSEIKIYNLNGKFINSVIENNGDGGVDWNLRNSAGEIVNSGVYIFKVSALDDSGNEIETKLGKFAVVK